MNKVNRLPDKIAVKIIREQGVFIAELPEYDLHTEADNIWELISNVNDIIRLYFDIPPGSQKGIVYYPPIENKGLQSRQLNSMDFFKYLPPRAYQCL